MLELFAMPLFARLGAAHRAPATVSGAKKCFCTRCGAHEQIRAGFHRAANNHRLTDFSIPRSHLLVSRPERAGRPFSMDQQLLLLSIDNVALKLRGVVRDV